MERTQAVEFIIRLEQTYLEQRDMKALLAAMAPGVTWIGSGRGEVCRGKQEARRLLEQDLAEYGGAFSITERWQEAEPLPGEGWLIYGGFRAEATRLPDWQSWTCGSARSARKRRTASNSATSTSPSRTLISGRDGSMSCGTAGPGRRNSASGRRRASVSCWM